MHAVEDEAVVVVASSVPERFLSSFDSGSGIRHLSRVGEPIQRTKKDAGPPSSDVGCLWSHTRFDVCVGGWATHAKCQHCRHRVTRRIHTPPSPLDSSQNKIYLCSCQQPSAVDV